MIRINPRAFIASWSELSRWDTNSLFFVQWAWPEEILQPLSEALERQIEPVDTQNGTRQLPIIEKISFGGRLTVRTEERSHNYKGRLFWAYPGNLVYSKIRVKQGSVAIIPDGLPQVAVSNEYPVYRIRPETALPHYLTLVLRSSAFKQLLDGLSNGGSSKTRVGADTLENLLVPLPPLPVQAAIVEAYETGMAEAARLRAEAARLEAEAAELLTQHLGLPLLTIKEATRGAQIIKWSDLSRWSLRAIINSTYFDGAYPLAMLGDITEIAYGITKDPSNRPGQNAKPYLRVANVQREGLDLREVKTIEVSPAEQERYQLSYGDILVCEGNSADLVGRPAMWRNEIPECIHQNHILRVRADEEKVLPDFLLAYMNSPQARRYFYSRAKFTTNLASINSTDLKELPVPLPPLDVQQQLIMQDEQLRTAAQTARIAAAETEAAAVARVEGMILGA